MDVHNIEVTIQHLCDTCQFEYKCVRAKGIKQALLTTEETALDKWRVDVETEFNIKRCDLYTADPAAIAKFIDEVIEDYFDDLGEEIVDRLDHDDEER